MERPVAACWASNELWLEDALHLLVSPEDAQLTFSSTKPISLEAVSLAFSEAHRSGGWLPLHAAAVAHAGQAIAITGPSGAGKSTATLRLAGLGFQVLGEDRIFWHPATGQVIGLDRCLRAFSDSLERFAPELLPLAQASPRDSKGKWMLPLSPVEQPALLRRMLYLGNGDTLSGAERVKVAWEATGVPLTDLARQQVQAGVNQLIPLLASQGVTRDSVLETVTELLRTPSLEK